MFTVVVFVLEKTTSIVASSWVVDGVSWWPPYRQQSRVDRAVKNLETPDDTWRRYDVRVLGEAGKHNFNITETIVIVY